MEDFVYKLCEKKYLSETFRLDLQVDTNMDYRARIKYLITKNIDITSHYDNEGGFGIGVMLRYL